MWPDLRVVHAQSSILLHPVSKIRGHTSEGAEALCREMNFGLNSKTTL
jgi:hypothetical protein